MSLSSSEQLETVLAPPQQQDLALRQRLVIEITETALLDSPERWSARLGRIRALGMAIAIDDFGVEFASLAYLFQFRPAA